jgi:hypothetical protein
MANRRFIDFPIAASVGNDDIVLIWQDGLNKQTTKATLFAGSPNSLAGLTDVDISALANGQILQYNSTTSKWENVDRTDIDLDQLGDVTIVSPTNGQVLVYNSSTSKWENSSAGFVPYTGAVTTVNLGAQSILAGSFVKAGGTSAQFLKADGSVDSNTYLTTGSAAATYVPYTGATADVNLGTHDLTAERGTFENNGSSNTLTVNHTSGSGYGIIVTKGGNNEALYVSKTSGSGNAMTVIGGRTSLVDLALSSVTNTAGDFLTLSGGVVHKRTAAEVRTDIGAGTVTSVAALTLGTSGTDLSSTVANGTTTPVITLNVPTASATNRGALSSADWSTFNSKQAQLNGTGFVKASGTTISYDNTSYLPLTGGTLTGLLTVNSSIISTTSFGGTFNATDGTNQVRFGSYQNSIGSGNSFDGVIYTTNASSALFILTGGSTTPKLTIASTGAATFSSALQTGGDISLMNASGDINIRMKDSSGNATRVLLRQATTNDVYVGDIDTNNGRVIIRTNGNDSVTISSAGAVQINNISGSGNRIVVANSSGTLISAVIGSGLAFDGTTLTASGSISGSGTSGTIALFTGTSSIGNSVITQSSGNVIVGGKLNSTISNNAVSFENTSITTGWNAVLRAVSTGGNFQLGLEGSSAGNRFPNSIAYATFLATYTTTPIQFATDNVHRMTITSGGNVLIGTTTDNGFKLEVQGGLPIVRAIDSNTSGANRVAGFRAQTNTSLGDFLSIANNANAPFDSNDGVYVMNRTSGSSLYFTTNNGGTEAKRLTLASTGAATFSGSFATPHTTKSANYTLTATDFTVGFDCASSRTANLPDATTCAGRIYVIYQYNTNNGARYVTLDGNGSQTINGLTTVNLQYYGDFSSVMIQSNGSNWVLISDALYFIPV